MRLRPRNIHECADMVSSCACCTTVPLYHLLCTNECYIHTYGLQHYNTHPDPELSSLTTQVSQELASAYIISHRHPPAWQLCQMLAAYM
jgi:hypothetical protein